MNTFWSMLGAPERAALLEVATLVTYEPGTRIFRAGEPSVFALVIEAGWVKVAGRGEDGETVLALRTCGDLVGESASADRPRIATVVTLREVRALMIVAPHFTDLLRDHPGAAKALQRTYYERQLEADQKRMNARSNNCNKRLAQLFLKLAADADSTEIGIVLDFPLTQGEYGQLIDAKKGIVERTLREWRERGIVSTMPFKHTIHDLARLSAIAHGRGAEGASSTHDGPT
jgi:CRP-like cAMP-binding protein